MIPVVSDLDKSQRFMKTKLATYVDRLMARQPKLDLEILAMLHWLIGPEILETGVEQIMALLTAPERLRFDEEIQDYLFDSYEFANALMRTIRGTRRNLEDSVRRLFRKMLHQRLVALQYPGKSQVENSAALFQKMFKLNDLESEICLFLSIIQVWDEARRLFEGHFGCERFEGRNYLAIVLKATDAEIASALNGKLAQIGILESDRGNSVCLEASFHQLLTTASQSDLRTEFFKKVDPNPVPLDAHVVDPLATQHLLSLLGTKTESSTHVLLYGSPGTGKTSYALGLAKELGLPVYLVEHAGKERQWSRQFAFTACVNMASHGEGSIVIADDCDTVLNTRNSWAFFGESSDKRWLHDLLETPGVRMIWTVNSISNIEESVARRFSFSLGFKPFGTAQRVRLWTSILNTHGFGSVFDAPQVKDLATKFQSSPGVIEQAVRKAAETGCNSAETLYTALNQSLEAHELLIHGGTKLTQAKPVDPNFTLEGLNALGTDLNALVAELKAYDQHVKQTSDNDGLTMALLFHGPSGTGKSHLARHIAAMLDREIIFKRGSDLLSMYVGGTEKNIRDAYEEASDNAVLVFDEADSLVFRRDRAERSWEISQTNEFLTWMEQFRGIQIFTTNRLSDMDSATLRRLNHKIEFHYLTPEGNVTFYKKLLAPLVQARISKNIVSQLKSLSRLAPGDFNVVRNKFKFKDPKQVTHQAIVATLREEAQLKSIHACKKAIGF